MKHRLRRTLLTSVVLHLLFLLVLPGLADRKTPESKATTLRVQLQMEGPAGQTKSGAGQPDRARTQNQRQRSSQDASKASRSEEKTVSKSSPETTSDKTPRQQAEKTTTKDRSRPQEAKKSPETTEPEKTTPEEPPSEPTGGTERLAETTSGERTDEPEQEPARAEGERTQLAQKPSAPAEPETSQREQESLVKSGGEQEPAARENSARETTNPTPEQSSSSSQSQAEEPEPPSTSEAEQEPSSSSTEESTPEERREPSPSEPEETPARQESPPRTEERAEPSSTSSEPTETEDAESGSSSNETLLTREGFFRSSSSSSREPVKSVSNAGNRTSVTETFERVRIKKEKLGPNPGGGDTEKGTIEEPSGGSVVAEVPVVRIGSGEAKGTGDYSLGVKPGSNETGYPKRSGRRVLHQPLPSVPPWLEKSGEEVRVVVLYTINGDGSIQSMEIHTSSGYPSLDEHVLNKVGQWRFEEGPDGEKRAVVFRFELKPAANA